VYSNSKCGSSSRSQRYAHVLETPWLRSVKVTDSQRRGYCRKQTTTVGFSRTNRAVRCRLTRVPRCGERHGAQNRATNISIFVDFGTSCIGLLSRLSTARGGRAARWCVTYGASSGPSVGVFSARPRTKQRAGRWDVRGTVLFFENCPSDLATSARCGPF